MTFRGEKSVGGVTHSIKKHHILRHNLTQLPSEDVVLDRLHLQSDEHFRGIFAACMCEPDLRPSKLLDYMRSNPECLVKKEFQDLLESFLFYPLLDKDKWSSPVFSAMQTTEWQKGFSAFIEETMQRFHLSSLSEKSNVQPALFLLRLCIQ